MFRASAPFGNQELLGGGEEGGCWTCQRGLGISFTAGLGLRVWRGTMGLNVDRGGNTMAQSAVERAGLTSGGGVQANSEQNSTKGEQGGLGDKTTLQMFVM